MGHRPLVEHAHDRWMIEGCDLAHLVLQTGQVHGISRTILSQELDGDRHPLFKMYATPDHTHSSLTHNVEEGKRPDACVLNGGGIVHDRPIIPPTARIHLIEFVWLLQQKSKNKVEAVHVIVAVVFTLHYLVGSLIENEFHYHLGLPDHSIPLGAHNKWDCPTKSSLL
jgi:hypothetical protein